MRTRVLPSGKHLRFNIEKHTYAVFDAVGDGSVSCSSVSGVLDRCFPFDSTGVATKVAMKSPATVPVTDPATGAPVLTAEGLQALRRPLPAEVQAEWLSRASLGSNVHAFIEQKILRDMHPTTSVGMEDKEKALRGLPPRMDCNGEEHLYYPAADAASSMVLEQYDPVEIELMIASPDLGLAGTIDFLGRNKKTGGLIVGDWKTSSSVVSEFKHFNFEEPAHRDHLPFLANEKQRRYALQVLIYGYLLRREGYLAAYDQPRRGEGYLPLEYGIIQLSKRIDGTVGHQFKKVLPSDIVPIDCGAEVTADDVIRSLIGF